MQSMDYSQDRYDAEWDVVNGERLQGDHTFEADVIIIGSGAGGGVAAERLSTAGLRVMLVEEGPLRTAKDFRLREDQAYADLYQEAAGRKTRDKGINILQGRSVGGSTTVNWTTSFRTPKPTRDYWQTHFATAEVDDASLNPWFEWVEQRLGIAPWPVDPNANNAVLRDGLSALGWSHGVIARNVKGCANLGYCGLGCPLNAKQSMLTTCIPAALALGARLLTRVRVVKLIHDGRRVASAQAVAMDGNGQVRRDARIQLRAKHFVLAGGAINTPALLQRSTVPDPFHLIGKRTFLHPVAISVAKMPHEVRADAGAPQSVYSDHFNFTDDNDRIGYKLEVPPIHPLIGSTILLQHGATHAAFMRDIKHMQATIALLRDGFHPSSAGGHVGLDQYGDAELDYPLNAYHWDGVRRALLSMAELQFAAGAEQVLPLHMDATPVTRFADAKRLIQQLPMQVLRMQLFSAHVMGGCALGEDPKRTVCDSNGSLRYMENVQVFDGSLFPTSLGVNPQVSIYALVAKLSEALLKRW